MHVPSRMRKDACCRPIRARSRHRRSGRQPQGKESDPVTDEINDADVIKRAHDDVSPEALKATGDLLTSFGQPRSRRWLMRGAATLGATATLASATAMTALPLHAAAANHEGIVTDIFSVAATAETLAVTFYNTAIAHAERLGLSWGALAAVKSFAREEDIHRSFFIAHGGTVATSVFSFPDGEDTFLNLRAFIETQQQLEVVFDSAFLLAVEVFAGLPNGAPLAQIAAQIAAVEQGHLAVGRYIGGFVPAEPYTFTPVLFTALSQIVPTVQAAGYLSPRGDNRFEYHPAREAFTVDNEPSGKTVLNATPPHDND